MSEKTNNPINDVINDYHKSINVKKNGNNYDKQPKRIKEMIDNIEICKRYDISSISVNHPLWEYISKTVGGVSKESNKTYLEHTGVVFDNYSNNFHIFPSDKGTYDELSDEFTNLRAIIRKNLMNYNNLSQKGRITRGGGYQFKLFRNIEEKMNVANQERLSGKNLYRFVEFKCEGISYTINFMRYTCNDKGEVGCTMRAIQFHKDAGDINRGEEGFEICYTSNDENYDKNNLGGLKTTKRTIGRGKGKPFINVCYNPPIEYPGPNPNKEQIEELIDHFLYFIENSDKIAIDEKVPAINSND